MHVKRIIISFLYSLLILSCGEKAVTENEPNDTLAGANLLAINTSIRGFLHTINDVDVYKIEVSNDTILDINMTGVKGVNIALRLLDGEQKVLKTIDDNRKSSQEHFANLYLKPGICYIEVRYSAKDIKVANTADYYELAVKGREPLYEEMEPNDFSEEATPILPGTEMKGYFSPSYNIENEDKDHYNREEDWFSIDVDLESEKPILMDVILTGVPGINAELHLCGPDLIEITKADTGKRSEGEEIHGIGITKSGKYYVMVTCKNYESNSDDPYYLSVIFREYDASREMEPNDSIETATLIVNDKISGQIDQPGDRDFFHYKPTQESGVYKLKLDSSDDRDYIIAVYNSKKDKILDINNLPVGEGEIYPDIALRSEFYLSVSSKNIGTKKSGYDLSVEPIQDTEFLELEPNNSKSEATRVYGNKIIGYISQKGDKDYYLLEYDDRTDKTFSIHGVKNGELKFSVTDPLGYIVKSVSVKGNTTVKVKEMIDKKGFLVIESVLENFDNPYAVTIRGNE